MTLSRMKREIGELILAYFAFLLASTKRIKNAKTDTATTTTTTKSTIKSKNTYCQNKVIIIIMLGGDAIK